MRVATYKWKAGDTALIEGELVDRRKRIPLADGDEVRFHVRAPTGTSTEIVTCTVDTVEQRVSFVPPAMFNTPGVYLSEFEVVRFPNTIWEQQITVPNGGEGDDYDRWVVVTALA